VARLWEGPVRRRSVKGSSVRLLCEVSAWRRRGRRAPGGDRPEDASRDASPGRPRRNASLQSDVPAGSPATTSPLWCIGGFLSSHASSWRKRACPPPCHRSSAHAALPAPAVLALPSPPLHLRPSYDATRSPRVNPKGDLSERGDSVAGLPARATRSVRGQRSRARAQWRRVLDALALSLSSEPSASPSPHAPRPKRCVLHPRHRVEWRTPLSWRARETESRASRKLSTSRNSYVPKSWARSSSRRELSPPRSFYSYRGDCRTVRSRSDGALTRARETVKRRRSFLQSIVAGARREICGRVRPRST